jgi:hypothetical protein
MIGKMEVKILPEDGVMLSNLIRVLDVSDPARPEDLRHVIIRFVIGKIILRIFKWA